MNYGEIKASFTAMLNRRDITGSMIENFVSHGIQRAQRLLRVPAAEATYDYTVPAAFEKLALPGDFLKHVSITVDGAELSRVTLSTARALAAAGVGTPRVYAREGAYYIIGPLPAEDAEIELIYQADFATLVDDEDSNTLTAIAPDIIVDGALARACLHYVDPRQEGFENSFIKSIADLNLQGTDDELTNAQISPAYSFDLDNLDG